VSSAASPVQLAKEAGAIVIATASPRSADTVRAFGADHIVDYTATTIAEAVKGPVGVVVNLVAGSREDTGALLDVTKPGGVLVSATSPGGEFPERDATVIFFSVRSDLWGSRTRPPVLTWASTRPARIR
jgi:NADPH:quinone reductase-like Zn-dependent oxidoreductase